jgi:hypothetical protein
MYESIQLYKKLEKLHGCPANPCHMPQETKRVDDYQ